VLAAPFQRAADATRKSCGDRDDAVCNLQAEGRQGARRGPSITSAPFLGSKTEPWHEQTRPMTTQQLRGAIVSRLADLFRILRERQRQPELGSNQAENPLAIEQSNDGQATAS
jgi:hypothetical protein